MSPVIATRRAAAHLAHDLSRLDRPLAALDGLAALQAAEVGTLGDAELAGALGVEAAGALLLGEQVAEGSDPVLDRERLDRVIAEAHAGAGLELVDLDRVADAADDPAERREQVAQPGRPGDHKGLGPVLHVPGLEQAGQPEVVVGVQVGDEDVIDLDESRRALHLPLRALAAVEEQPVAAAPDQHRGGVAPRRGHRAAGAEKDHVEVHGAATVVDASVSTVALPRVARRGWRASAQAISRAITAARMLA